MRVITFEAELTGPSECQCKGTRQRGPNAAIAVQPPRSSVLSQGVEDPFAPSWWRCDRRSRELRLDSLHCVNLSILPFVADIGGRFGPVLWCVISLICYWCCGIIRNQLQKAVRFFKEKRTALKRRASHRDLLAGGRPDRVART
jgi:hypothetical protein